MKFTQILSLVLIFSINLYSQVSINGYVKTDNRFRMQQDGKLSWNDNSLGLKFTGSPSDNIYYYSEVRIRGFGFSDVHSTADLQRRQKDFVQTWGLEFRLRLIRFCLALIVRLSGTTARPELIISV